MLSKRKRAAARFVVASMMLLAAGMVERQAAAQTQLVVTYGPQGLQQISYGSDTLEDVERFPADAFHIWHMKITDLHGKPVTSGQYGWGETNTRRSWNPSTKTWTYAFTWGSIQTKFAQQGSTLNLTVTETNLANSGVILDGVSIYPLGLHFPHPPQQFGNAGQSQLTFNTIEPGILTADYFSGEVMAVTPDASKPLYSGFIAGQPERAYWLLISSTAPDSLATFQPHFDRPVKPGESDTFTVSLRFAPSGTSTAGLAADAYANWAKVWPSLLHWTDRRPIGTIFLASSPSGDSHRPGGFPNNPRRYFNNENARDFDISSEAGLAAFQERVLDQAAINVLNMRKLGAQGAITWDIEGEQYPQNTSYACAPDSIAEIAPEMESIVADRKSPFHGMRLDDAYFKVMTSAGFRVGVCVRPQHFTLGKDGLASQVYLDNGAVPLELMRKMKFAHDRWGATLFYVDSSVESNGAVLDASIFEHLAQAFPDSLIMPEESTPRDYAYTAPFLTFLFHGDIGTVSSVHSYYPSAFSVNLINDVSREKLAKALPSLTEAVAQGDILMGLVGTSQQNNPVIASIYRAAANREKVEAKTSVGSSRSEKAK